MNFRNIISKHKFVKKLCIYNEWFSLNPVSNFTTNEFSIYSLNFEKTGKGYKK